MTDYKELYFSLFSAYSDAVEAIEQLNFGICKEILVRAQQEAEELYISADEE